MEGYDRNNKGKGWQGYTPSGDTPENDLNKFVNDVIEGPVSKLSNKRKALDVGCGNGRHSFILSELFENVTGIDISYPTDSRFIRENIEYCKMDFMDVDESEFDLILFWGSFYMMENYKNAIQHCYNLLQTDGILIIGDDPARRKDRCENTHDDCVSYDLSTLIKENNLKEIYEFISDYRITVIKKI
tara:strand:- start:1996 stop:2556 length:561 start_codon:yes stop_codon:yes gene_type:complete